jgi:hypothetical protein
LLQAAYSNYQIGPFENFHELVEDMFIVLRPGPKVFFQYELRFVNRLKSQLLISHLFFPIKEMPSGREKEATNQAAFWEISPTFWISRSIFVSIREAQRPNRGASWFHMLPKFPWRLRMAAAPEPARFVKVRCWRRFSEVGRSPT